MRHISWTRWVAGALAGAFTAGILYAQPSSPAGPAVYAPGVLGSPVRITAMDNGPLLVTGYNSQSVCMVSRVRLAVLRCFAVEGKPLAVAWVNDRVYVGNETTGAVEVYNPAGKWLFDLGGGKGTIGQPADMAVDEKSGKIFVTDGRGKNIRVYSLDGTVLGVISGPLTGEGRIVNPTGIALDTARGEIFVSDYGDPASSFPARIHRFDYAGNYTGGIRGRTGGFSRPQGLAVEGDLLFATDGMLGSVLVFDLPTGAKVKTIGEFGAGPGQLMLPLDVMVDAQTGDVYITNNRNGRVERIEEGGLVP